MIANKNPEIIGSTVWVKGLRYCRNNDGTLERMKASNEPYRHHFLKFSGYIKNVQIDDDKFERVHVWDTKAIAKYAAISGCVMIITVAYAYFTRG